MQFSIELNGLELAILGRVCGTIGGSTTGTIREVTETLWDHPVRCQSHLGDIVEGNLKSNRVMPDAVQFLGKE